MLIFLYSIFLLIRSTYPISFNIPRFDSNDTNMLYQGDASTETGVIQLNKANYVCRVGRATYAQPVHLWDPTTQNLSDFTTRFSFTIDTRDAIKYGHGFAFFLAPFDSQIPPNSAGGFLGLFNTTTTDTTSKNQIVAVEFDTYYNSDWDPPDQLQHVGINVNSIASAVHVTWNATGHRYDIANVEVSYNSSVKKLNVSMTYQGNPINNANYTLSYDVDLMKVLPERVMVGFSAGTSQYTEKNIIWSWEFSSSLESEVRTGKKNSNIVRWIVGAVASLVSLIGGVGLVILIWRRRKEAEDNKRKQAEESVLITSSKDSLETIGGCRSFSYGELVKATNNFIEKLGEGGFGGVYRGFLSDLRMAVAVKKILNESPLSKNGFLNEAKIISRLRHPNLVQLIGWCHDRGEFLLVYDFMSNGSLDSHLFGKKVPLTWGVRYNIALGLASALLYLHQGWEQCVVHRDIKSSNLMLDSNFNAKLGDFGLARLVDHGRGMPTTDVAGTRGYLAPECFKTFKPSKESDIYSFGVVALEIACGRMSLEEADEESQVGLVAWVWELYGDGRLFDAVDEKLSNDFDERQMECLIMVGLWCSNPDHAQRPPMSQALNVLKFEEPMPNLPTEMPVPRSHRLHSNEGGIITNTSVVGR